MAEATNAFGVASLRDAISQGKTAVTDMYLDAGIDLTAAQQNIIDTQMFLPDGSPNPRFKVGEFWKDTFGKAREGSKKFDPLASIMDGSLISKIPDMVTKLPDPFGGMIMAFLRSLPVIGGMFAKAEANGPDSNTSEGVKSYIDETPPAPAAVATQQPALVAGAPSPDAIGAEFNTVTEADVAEVFAQVGVTLTDEMRVTFAAAADVIPYKDGVTLYDVSVEDTAATYNDANAGLSFMFKGMDELKGAELLAMQASLVGLAEEAVKPENEMFHPDLYLAEVPEVLITLAGELLSTHGIKDDDGSIAKGLAFAAYATDEQFIAEKVTFEKGTNEEAPDGAIVLTVDPKYPVPGV